ncbi:TolC family protein, partial [Campylobacter jejuni]
PSLSLDGSFVFTALHPEDVFKYDSSGWSTGPSLTAPLFNGGALKARKKAAEAAAKEADATYRQTVLTAFA